jgi:hypothetical protein
VTYTTNVAAEGTTSPHEAMANRILALLENAQHVVPLREKGYQIGISCDESGIVASATAVESAQPTLTARVNVAQWWDAKQLGDVEWARQLAHALAGALRTQDRRSSVDDRGRYGFERAAPGRLRLRMPVLPGRSYRVTP